MSSATRELARELGLIETVSVERDATTTGGVRCGAQPFDYLLVMDFEATCWAKEHRKIPPEIIEFSVVLYDVKRGTIEEEFQQYVMPTEEPKLSTFCTNLTGIKQAQVDAGVPIATCLMLFNKWLKLQYDMYDFNLDPDEERFRKCAFVTWSDWDLGTCLRKECRRKGISKSCIYNRWIDLRALYLEYYKRSPKGLNGALSELGLKFVGVEHCGLDDAKNTTYLTRRMILDGVLLRYSKNSK